MKNELIQLFGNKQLLAQTIKNMPPMYTPVLDTVYKTRRQHPFSYIKVEDIAEVVGAVPVVRRGAPGVSLEGNTSSVTLIEPHPIKVKDVITGKDINDLKSVGREGLQAFVQNKIEKFRRAVKMSTEILASQSLSGVVSYPMVLENGQIAGIYEVDFTNGGTNAVASYTPATLWSDPGKDIPGVIRDMTEMKTILQDQGYGTNVRIWAGKNAFFRLLEIANSSTNPSILPSSDNRLTLPGGYSVELRAESYTKPDETTENPVADNEVVMFDEAAPFGLFYLAIDDVQSLQATPLYIKTWNDEDRGALMVSAESKSLPIPVIKAIVRATVM